MSHKKKILFVLKERSSYGVTYGISYGLAVSCQMVADSLKSHGVESKIVTVVDGNGIDKEVHNYKPTHVVLEAIWVPPYKIAELLKLHKHINWTVRIHSKFPFLAQERMAIEWLIAYNSIAKQFKNFTISANNKIFIDEINATLHFNVKYAPNCYIIDDSLEPDTRPVGEILDIGCFGALRILKNHLLSAIAAIYYADVTKKRLRFHINNSSRFEKEGNPILNNLINLFKDTKHELVTHDWESHDSFIKLVKKMDVGMQVSLTESFNIVAADFVTAGVPIVGSPEIEFLAAAFQADPTSMEDIVNKLDDAIRYKKYGFQAINEVILRKHTRAAIKAWLYFLN